MSYRFLTVLLAFIALGFSAQTAEAQKKPEPYGYSEKIGEITIVLPQPPGDPVKLKGKEIEGADYRKERRTLRRSGNTHYSGDTLFNGNDCTGKTKTETYAHYYRAEECVDHVKYICLHHEHKEFTYSNDGSVLCGFKDYSLTDCFVGGEC